MFADRPAVDDLRLVQDLHGTPDHGGHSAGEEVAVCILVVIPVSNPSLLFFSISKVPGPISVSTRSLSYQRFRRHSFWRTAHALGEIAGN